MTFHSHPFPELSNRGHFLSALSRGRMGTSRLVSLGPDCGVRTRIDEQALPWNKCGPTNFFDWTLSNLSVVALVLECTDPDVYFQPAMWSMVRVWPSGSYEFVHVPTGLRSLHDARVSEYESTDAACSAVATRYVRRWHRLHELLKAPGSLRFVHVVDGENEMNVCPPPSRDAIRRVRRVLEARHHLVIVHDGTFASLPSLTTANIAFVDTREFQLKAQEQANERGETRATHELSGWRRAHLDWESLLLAVSVAVPPADYLRLQMTVGADAGRLNVQVAICSCASGEPVGEPATAEVAAPALAASLRCVFEVMPQDGDVRAEDVYLAACRISLPGVQWCGWRTEPLFFGLEKLILIMRLCDDDACEVDDVLRSLHCLDSVQSARLLSATKGADAFDICSRLFSVTPERVHDLHLPCLTAKAAAALIHRGWAIVDNWMAADVVERVASLAGASLIARNSGSDDGVKWRTPEPRFARTDVATWLTADQPPASDPLLAARLLPRFDALASDLRALMDGVAGRLEVQLACFPADVEARYRRHTDANADGWPMSAERKVTCILYCNPAWTPAHAGRLRLTLADHDKGGAAGTVDIDPIGGQLLVFMSGAIAHEVLATKADRFAVTAWLA